MEQGLVFIRNKVSTWKDKNQLKTQLLDALLMLAIERPEENEIGFLAIDLILAIREIRGSNWFSSNDPELMAKRIREIWKESIHLWDEKYEGIIQELGLSEDIKRFPRLDKIEGGGKGNPSRYKIVWEDTDLLPSEQHYPNAYQEASIAYICEDVTNPGFFARIFSKGIEITGWRRWLFLTVIALPLLVGWLLLVVFLGQISLWEQFGSVSIFKTLGGLVVIWGLIWATIGKLINLPTKKIVSAPYWMQSDDNDRLLEHRHPPKYPVKSIKAVHYTAKCPICGGKVNAMESKFEFLGRIVGRCENAPVEHVFSFDHYTRSGKHLRD